MQNTALFTKREIKRVMRLQRQFAAPSLERRTSRKSSKNLRSDAASRLQTHNLSSGSSKTDFRKDTSQKSAIEESGLNSAGSNASIVLPSVELSQGLYTVQEGEANSMGRPDGKTSLSHNTKEEEEQAPTVGSATSIEGGGGCMGCLRVFGRRRLTYRTVHNIGSI